MKPLHTCTREANTGRQLLPHMQYICQSARVGVILRVGPECAPVGRCVSIRLWEESTLTLFCTAVEDTINLAFLSSLFAMALVFRFLHAVLAVLPVSTTVSSPTRRTFVRETKAMHYTCTIIYIQSLQVR